MVIFFLWQQHIGGGGLPITAAAHASDVAPVATVTASTPAYATTTIAATTSIPTRVTATPIAASPSHTARCEGQR